MMPVFPGTNAISPDLPPDQKALSALVTLHQRTVDARAGFDAMVEKAEPAFRPIALSFQDLHSRQAVQIAELIVRAGGEPDPDGTFMSTVNRVVIATRAFFDQIDADVMDQVRTGEDHVLAAFQDCLDDPVDSVTDTTLRRLHDELTALLATTRQLD